MFASRWRVMTVKSGPMSPAKRGPWSPCAPCLRTNLERHVAPGPLSDDVMVWIGQIVHQDVNLLRRPELLARVSAISTPQACCRAARRAGVSRDRAQPLPTSSRGVAGPLAYVVAAAPMPSGRRDFMRVRSRPASAKSTRDRRTERGVLVARCFRRLFAAGSRVCRTRVSDPVKPCRRRHAESPGRASTSRFQAGVRTSSAASSTSSTTWPANSASNKEEEARTNQLKAWAEMARQSRMTSRTPRTPISWPPNISRRVCGSRPPLGGVPRAVRVDDSSVGAAAPSDRTAVLGSQRQCPVRRPRCRRAAR